MNILKSIKKFSEFIIPIVVFLFDGIFLYLGYRIDSFLVLEKSLNNGEVIYKVSNSDLMIVFVICLINVLALYHAVVIFLIGNKVSSINNETIDKDLNRIEAHLINFDKNTIPFNDLSAIEAEVGIGKKSISNEVWIITNNFEEREDSPEGKQLRDAIISNLKTAVRYYYIIPPIAKDDFDKVCQKLKQDIKKSRRLKKIPKDSFNFLVDEGLDFIPSPYYDIIMYIKIGNPNGDRFVETTSKLYYCFSKEINSENCQYQEISINIDGEKEIWTRVMNTAIQHSHSNFQTVNLIEEVK